jgi:hypothetical protein
MPSLTFMKPFSDFIRPLAWRSINPWTEAYSRPLSAGVGRNRPALSFDRKTRSGCRRSRMTPEAAEDSPCCCC